MTPIYHITHGRNLNAMIAAGGLWCDAQIIARGRSPLGIAYQHIKERRKQRQVPCAVGGTLADYVPFYFAPRSPMLYAIHSGFVEGYEGGHGGVLHLVAEAETVAASGCVWAFTEGHAEITLTEFYTDLRFLSAVDWAIMRETYWHDTDEDGDRKRRRQAEFLVHQFFAWELIGEIGVINRQITDRVRTILDGAAHQPIVTVRQGWYY
ncbi:DUF4433 domain-containing protein [Candidatus Gracilibacteria bacterium]|nr:DUF4433 domain-containing protein [Candidatus Gracilibacteria bacterium]